MLVLQRACIKIGNAYAFFVYAYMVFYYVVTSVDIFGKVYGVEMTENSSRYSYLEVDL